MKTNDNMQVMYVCSLIRSVISLHNLVLNKVHTKDLEMENLKKEKEREEELRKKKEEEAKKKVEAALGKGEEESK